MALSRANHLGEEQSDVSAGALSVNFTAFTPQSNSLLVAFIYYVGNVTQGTTGVLSGGGLTWTLRVRSPIGTDASYFWNIEIWTAPVGTAASTTLNYANAPIVTLTDARVQISAFSYTGYDVPSPTGGKGTWDIGTNGFGLGTIDFAPAIGDAVVSGAAMTPSGATNTTMTPETGSTEIHDIAGSPGYGNMETQERLSNTSTTVGWNEVNDDSISTFPGNEYGAALVIRVNTPVTGSLGQFDPELFLLNWF